MPAFGFVVLLPQPLLGLLQHVLALLECMPRFPQRIPALTAQARPLGQQCCAVHAFAGGEIAQAPAILGQLTQASCGAGTSVVVTFDHGRQIHFRPGRVRVQRRQSAQIEEPKVLDAVCVQFHTRSFLAGRCLCLTRIPVGQRAGQRVP